MQDGHLVGSTSLCVMPLVAHGLILVLTLTWRVLMLLTEVGKLVAKEN